jgi:hypothetical protein
VDIEYAPDPKEEFLDDRTAFDAFVEFDRVDGTRGFVGIETKLTEPFSRKTYDGRRTDAGSNALIRPGPRSRGHRPIVSPTSGTISSGEIISWRWPCCGTRNRPTKAVPVAGASSAG